MVQYFGQVFADRDVPWHYPWFYFAVTVPVGFRSSVLVGIVRAGGTAATTRSRCSWRGRSWSSCALQHQGPGLRRRTAVPACLPGLGPADRAGFRLALGAAPRRVGGPGGGCRPSWSPRVSASWRSTRSGSATTMGWSADCRGGTAGTGADLLERRGRSGAAGPAGARRAAGASAALVPTLYPGQGVLTTNRALARREIILRTSKSGPGRSGSSSRVGRLTGVRTQRATAARRRPSGRAHAGKESGCPHCGIFRHRGRPVGPEPTGSPIRPAIAREPRTQLATLSSTGLAKLTPSL